jgi:hypothetical protein
MEGIFIINNKVNKYSPKENIFLCKKIKREQKKNSRVFLIKKSKKIKKENSWHESTNDSTLEESQSFYEPKKIPSINEILIPNFLNDKDLKKESKIQEKLKKYSEVSNVFIDSEDRELYLVRKESLY